jgi:uncharacterized protein YkwD
MFALTLGACAYAAPMGAAAAPVASARALAGHRASHHACRTFGTPHRLRACLRGVRGHRSHHARRAHHTPLSHHTPPTHPRSATPRRVPATAAPAQPGAAGNPALLASILATPCQNTGLTPEAGNIGEVKVATLCLINQERARHGELPLQLNGQLEQAAEGHSQEMVAQDYFAHVAPDGLTPLARVRDTGYIPSSEDGYTIGENIAWGTLEFSTPAAIVRAWIASPEHLANILEGQYRDTAIGVDPAAPAALANGQDGAVYTQEFGVIVQ